MSSPTEETKVDAAIAMVATSSRRLPDVAGILAACGMASAGRGVLGSIFGRKSAPSDDHRWDDGHLVFPFRDAQLAVSLMPAPVPWSDLEGPCATAWWWPEATEHMRRHRYHFLVALIGGSIDQVERRVILTKVVSAVVSGTDAVGVYWAEGTVVHEPGQFVEQAESASEDDIPGPLWIDVRIEENDDGSYRCFTTGMAHLGFLEIEVERSRLAPEELMEFIGNTACYIVNGRKQIEDGETMGRTESERYKVRHVPSMFDRSPVMSLVME
jgi:hypothetical protein